MGDHLDWWSLIDEINQTWEFLAQLQVVAPGLRKR